MIQHYYVLTYIHTTFMLWHLHIGMTNLQTTDICQRKRHIFAIYYESVYYTFINLSNDYNDRIIVFCDVIVSIDR